MLEQIVSGLHTRLYARAYIVADPSQDRYLQLKDGLTHYHAEHVLHLLLSHWFVLHCSNRFVFVNLDACMATQAVTLGVVERLKVNLNGPHWT